jgi:hypothetical protein
MTGVRVTGIRVSCPSCGDVGLFVNEVTVRCCDEIMHATYRFRCPLCSLWTVKEANAAVVAALIEAGSPVEHWRLPLEIHERPERAALISHDDLIDFHQALERLPTAIR